MTDPAEEKRALRAEMKARRAKRTPEEVRAVQEVTPALLFSPRALNLLAKYRTFASYLSAVDEFPTRDLHDHLFLAQAIVSVPRFYNNTKVYNWAELTPFTLLREGPHRILEPAPPVLFPRSAIEVVLTPGLAFDVLGNRLGYGAGIYDRLLTQLRPNIVRIGLAFDFQVFRDELPHEPHDIPMTYIVTESQWIDCHQARAMRRSRNA